MRRGTLVVVFSILFLVIMPVRASYIAEHVPELRNSIVLVADLYGQGESTLIFGQGHSVFALSDNTILPLIAEISGRVSALAVGDVNGDFQNELIVGTDSGGALNFYVWKDSVWERQGQPQYLWDVIRLLEVHDFNSDGWGDVVVLTGRGEAQVLLSSEGTLYPSWKSKTGEVVVGIEVTDVDHDGRPELIFAFESGYIGVLKWDQEFVTMWENYPWGSIESLVVVPHANAPEWLVVTSQKMLYAWRFRDGEVVSSRRFEGNELGENLFYFPDLGLMSLSQKTGISLFDLQTAAVSEKWRIPGLFGNEAFSYHGDLYFRDLNNVYYRIVSGSATWRIFLQDQEITNLVEVVNQEGELFYRLPDLAPHLGAVGVTDNSWHYLIDGHEVVFRPESNLVKYDQLPIPMKNPIVAVDGQPYVSAEVLPFFGWKVELDSSRQQVVLQRNWGWWL